MPITCAKWVKAPRPLRRLSTTAPKAYAGLTFGLGRQKPMYQLLLVVRAFVMPMTEKAALEIVETNRRKSAPGAVET